MEKKKTVNLDMKQYGMVIALIAIYLIFTYLSGGNNASPMNINNLIMQNGYIVILAIGMLLCVLLGYVDLSVGSTVALCGAISAIMVVDFDLPVPVAFLAAVVVGILAGVVAGIFIAYLGIPPFVVTLATMLMNRGLTYTVLKAQTKGPLPESYTQIGAGFLPSLRLVIGDMSLDLLCLLIAITATAFIIFYEIKGRATKKKHGFSLEPLWQIIVKEIVIIGMLWFFLMKLALYKGIPIVLVLLGVLIVVYYFITTKTVAGRQIYALGGNVKAAKLTGINVRKVYFWVYVNMGLLCAIAGIVLSARNGSATPKAGDGFELDAMASCYIGGAATSGGIGTVIGTVVGAFIMGILNNGMSLIGWSTDIQKFVKGMVLLGAVTVDFISKKKANR